MRAAGKRRSLSSRMCAESRAERRSCQSRSLIRKLLLIPASRTQSINFCSLTSSLVFVTLSANSLVVNLLSNIHRFPSGLALSNSTYLDTMDPSLDHLLQQLDQESHDALQKPRQPVYHTSTYSSDQPNEFLSPAKLPVPQTDDDCYPYDVSFNAFGNS